jgi:hypothetical protein
MIGALWPTPYELLEYFITVQTPVSTERCDRSRSGWVRAKKTVTLSSGLMTALTNPTSAIQCVVDSDTDRDVN